MDTNLRNERITGMSSCKVFIELLQRKLNLQHVRVAFDEKKVLKERLMQGSHVVFFTPIDSESERDKYEKKPESAKAKYKTKSPMIHFPDVSIDEFVQIFQCGVEDEFVNTISRLKKEYDIVADKYTFVSFLFLHEVGHWNQLQDDDRMVHMYLLRDLTEEKNIHDAQNAIISSALRRNGKDTLGDGLELTHNEKEKLRKLQEEYRNVPKEAEADEYAAKMLRSVDLSEYYQGIM